MKKIQKKFLDEEEVRWRNLKLTFLGIIINKIKNKLKV